MDQSNHFVNLTAAEMAQLWTAFLNDSAASCILTYMTQHVEDPDIQPIVKKALNLSNTHIEKLTTIFINENYPVPCGFNLEDDVDVTAPKLYSDTFVLQFLHQMGKIGLQAFSVSLSFSTREDIYTYFQDCIYESTALLKEVSDLLLSKGIYIRAPFLTKPNDTDFVKSQSFLTGFFGDRRPLTAHEISHLFANFQRNALGAATLIGFSQVSQTKEVTKYFLRGKNIAQKHCEVFNSILRENDLPTPTTWDTEITDSTTYTFSDKLMMFYTTALIALSIGYYGTSVAVSARRDIGVHYGRITGEIGKYAEDGANIMIKHGWLEEPPRALDRDELAAKKQ